MNQFKTAFDLDGVAIRPLLENADFPRLISPVAPNVSVTAWITDHRREIDDQLRKCGALLFRGFPIDGAAQFEAVVEALSRADWVEYREAATPRSHVDGHVFTSTEYYPQLRIYVHNENSHVTSWPAYIFFHCRTPAPQGGETPLADCVGVYNRLPANLLERFTRTGWMYRRNFHPGSSITWQKAFGTDSRDVLDEYLQRNYMTAHWAGDVLTVRYRRWAVLRHSRMGVNTWFNHGTFFNPYANEPAVRNTVLAMGENRMPYNTYYGDGSPVDEPTVRTLDEAYAAETVSFPWRAGDVLMLDNMRIAHGRAPFTGAREVLVAMKEKMRCEDVAAFEQYSPPA